jgi:hypothetical protein
MTKETMTKEEFIKTLPTEMNNEWKESIYRLWVHFNYDDEKVLDYLIKEFKDVFGFELTKK